MQPTDISHSQRVLQQRRRELQSLIYEMGKDSLNVPLQDSISELSSYDNHPADISDATFERSKDLALRENAQLEVDRIDEALQAIKEGTYGTCRICGIEIETGRLSIMPEAVTCTECSKESEAGDKMVRPLEEDVVTPPFNMEASQDFQSIDQNNTTQNQVGYDGEDAWQEVARFGTSDAPQDQPESPQYPNVYVDADEDRGSVDYIDSIPYRRDEDGMIYEDE